MSEDPERGTEPTAAPTFVNGGDCTPSDSADLRRAGCVTSVTADADGDGSFDELIVYARIDSDARPRSWRLRIETAESVIDQSLDAGNAFSYPRALGSADIDSDGRAEFFIKVADYTSHGAPWSRMDLVVLASDRIERVTFEGVPLAVNYGGISRLGEGATCRSRRLVLLRAEAVDRQNTTWRYSERTFDIEGATATLLDRATGTLTIDDYNDPDLDPFYRVDCSGFIYPR